MKKTGLLLLLISVYSFNIFGQNNIIPLWPNEMPNHKVSNETEVTNATDVVRISKVQTPTIEVFTPAKKNSNGQAVLICPGGGYRILAYDSEGTDIAKWLNSKGITAFVLKYRLPDSQSVIESYKAPLTRCDESFKNHPV